MAEEKSDLERVGLFEDGPYDTDTSVRDPPERKDDDLEPFPRIPGHKTKAATNDWTFDEAFLYLWEESPYEDPGEWRRKYVAEKREQNLHGEFNSTIPVKKMNGSGTLYGTFLEGKDYESFSPEEKDKKEDDLGGVPNFLTNPGKKGTGYGYAGVCLNSFPEYMEDPLFDQYEAIRDLREKYEEGLLDRSEWIPAGPPKEFFDSNPFRNSRDPEGQTETYDFSRLIPKEFVGEEKPPFLPSNPTKKINGNKDVVAPLERFPEYRDGDDYVDPPINVFRKLTLDPEKPLWKPQTGFRTRQSRSVISQNINFRINSSNFHMF